MARLSFGHAGAAIALLLVAAAGTSAQVTRNLGNGWQVTIPNIDVIDVVRDTTVAGNVPVLEKFATFLDFNTLDLVFQQTAPNALTSTRIILTDEYVFNATGSAWSAFNISLVNQSGGSAVFNQAQSASFTIAPFTTRAYAGANTSVTYAGGTVANNAFWTPGVLSGALVIDITLAAGGDTLPKPTVFTLREVPVAVPAPGAGAIALVGAGMLGARRRRGASVKGGCRASL